jgi:hypothetical protein
MTHRMLTSVQHDQDGPALLKSQWINNFQLSWRSDGERGEVQTAASQYTILC